MSPHAANSLVHDLVQMAQAMEQLPQVREELRDTKDQLNSALNTVQRLEAKLMDRANEINELNQKVRSAEASRDDAETMFLEADERTSRALDFIKATFGNAGSLIQALEPTKPEPKSDAKLEDIISGYPYGEPVAQPAPDATPIPIEESPYYPPSAMPAQETVSVQEDPIASQDTQCPSASVTAEPMVSAPLGDGENLTAPNPPGPYHGLCYFDVRGYITLSDWLAGGGSEWLYFHRPDEAKAAE